MTEQILPTAQNTHDKFHSSNGKRQLLVADDEMINREILGNLLEADYEVIYACDGGEAFRLIGEHHDTLSCVLLDLQMPVMNGLEILEKVKNDPVLRHVPIIVITSSQETEIESLTLGANDFIPKPYPQPGVILARVLRTIELSEDREIISSTERDVLTGLFNREFFYRYAEQFDLYHQNLQMDAIVVDIYHFHMINERFGSEYGDEVLRRIAEKLRDAVKNDDGIVCRREADTFMIYCPHGKDYGKLLEAASVGLGAVGGVNNRVRLRMGVYEDVDKSLNVERRFDRAQMAADTVRIGFSNNISIYDASLHEKELFAEQLIESFPAALAEKQIKVYYQPKFDVRPDVPVLASAEALVRWVHPKFGMISPGVFIPLFEENGVIRQLDRYVWRETAAQLGEWKKRFGMTVPVSVNVSRIDMYDHDLIEYLRSLLAENSLSASELILEITESAYTNDSEQIIETVNELRRIGFRIEMDDFGSGYSSLNMISTLPIDALKLDMQFIRTAFSEKKDTRLIEVIIDIADYLAVPVIAEGVETQEQMLALKAMGCDMVQGYYFSKPVPAEEYERFLAERAKQVGESAESGILTFDKGERNESSFGKISRALSSDYESIYYVDVNNNHYVRFSSAGRYDELEIAQSGSDFFVDMLKDIPRIIHGSDRERVIMSLGKENLMSRLSSGRSFSMIYRLIIDGEPVYYSLKAVRADDSHMVIGISNVNDQIRNDEESNVQSLVSFSSIARSLAQDYFCIYYVNLDNNHFVEYSADESYHKLNIEKGGNDFFDLSRDNFARVGHPDDLGMFLEAFTKENILKAIDEKRTFTLTYRLMLNGRSTYVHMKVSTLPDEEDHHVVIGISKIDAQMRREQEFALALRAANRDALTGVKSLNAYKDVSAEINSHIVTDTAEDFAVAVCDVNGLKAVNDTQGHHAGDEYIRGACRVICGVFKHSPVFRIGGDEFVALLSGADFEHREALLEIMEDANREAIESGDATIACGIAEYRPGEDSSLSEVFDRADAAMYERKRKMKEKSAAD